MARNRLLRRAQDETTLRYGGEIRGLQHLLREARGERRQSVRAATGTAAGMTRATRAARAPMRRVYGEAETAFGAANQDVQGALGAGYQGSAAQREAAGASRRLAESKAGALSELTSRGVDAEVAKQYAITQARSQFKQDRSKIRAQAQDLEREMGTYLATTYRDLQDAERKYRQAQQRIKISERNAQRMMRATLADITGRDPATGRLTADERDRRKDNALARQKERRIAQGENGKKGPSRGAVTKHQDLVADIQDAKRAAARARKKGAPWGEIAPVLTMNRSDSPFGLGASELVAQAGVQLARGGRLSPAMVRALKARGLLPRRAPFKRDQGRGRGLLGDVQNTIGDLLG